MPGHCGESRLVAVEGLSCLYACLEEEEQPVVAPQEERVGHEFGVVDSGVKRPSSLV